VSFTLEDSTAACLRDGHHLSAALQQLQGCVNLAAVLVNCCAPAAVTAALPVLKLHAPPGQLHGHLTAEKQLVAALSVQSARDSALSFAVLASRAGLGRCI
jgi:S-methylmethionine-dependent homocysteine/selenocysteine methylase